MSLWHLSPLLSARVSSSDLFTFPFFSLFRCTVSWRRWQIGLSDLDSCQILFALFSLLAVIPKLWLIVQTITKSVSFTWDYVPSEDQRFTSLVFAPLSFHCRFLFFLHAFSSVSPSLSSFHSTALMYSQLAMCSSSQLVFPLICSSFISGRHTCPKEKGGREILEGG